MIPVKLLDKVHLLPLDVVVRMHIHTDDIEKLSDESLLSYALEHPDAFSFLVKRYQREFLERAQYIVKSRDDAEDVVQDAFVRIYRFAPRFRGQSGTFKNWALTILMNVARTRYQQKAREWKRTAPLTQEHYEGLAAPSGEEGALAKDIIERALLHVGEETATLLKLAFIDELPYEEIAKRQGIRVGAVKTRVHRAKRSLRSIIGNITL
ncbi:MAG: RNA polymerase sigma factor [Patescibacteria group bacterium]